jgi:hypothetical protein
LDGVLDDEVWQSDGQAALNGPAGSDLSEPAALWWAYDREFLLLAIRCPKAPGAAYPTTSAPRSRDSDLSQHDRIDLRIDVNRDYSSYWWLSVDHRGWTNDRCQTDATWDPQWYVAAAADEHRWQIEAAIPLAELVARPPASGQAWRIGVQRTVPGGGGQSWTLPSSVDIVPPERFGYLVFE